MSDYNIHYIWTLLIHKETQRMDLRPEPKEPTSMAEGYLRHLQNPPVPGAAPAALPVVVPTLGPRTREPTGMASAMMRHYENPPAVPVPAAAPVPMPAPPVLDLNRPARSMAEGYLRNLQKEQ